MRKIYINAWDYVLYSYLEVCPAEEEYPVLAGGLIDNQIFYKKIFSGKYDAVIQYPGNGQIDTIDAYVLSGSQIISYNNQLNFREINLADEVTLFYRCTKK